MRCGKAHIGHSGRALLAHSTDTRMTPARIMPSARAAGTERSMTRPRTNGPRSLTRHWSECPAWLTVTMPPMGLVRCVRIMPHSRDPLPRDDGGLFDIRMGKPGWNV